MQDKLLLIDGSSFIFRAFHAVTYLNAPDGMPTGAIYGVTSMIKQMLKKYYHIKYWAFVCDAKGPTFRHDIYPNYKANRKETPQDLIPQFDYIYKIIAALGIKVITQQGVEADDVIASITMLAKQHNFKILIATGDKDFTQLVDDDVSLVNTMTNEELNHDAVVAKFGVTPKQMIDYLALIGDTADNVPGIYKCGPKTASKWLNTYNSLENIVINANNITGAIAKHLQDGLAFLPQAKYLITLHTNLDLSATIPNGVFDLKLSDNCITGLIDDSNYHDCKILYTYYQYLGFNSWSKQLYNLLSKYEYAIQTIVLDDKNIGSNDVFNDSVNADNKNIIDVKSYSQLSKIINHIIMSPTPVIDIIVNITSKKELNIVIFSHQGIAYLCRLQNSDLIYDNLKILFENTNIQKNIINYKEALHALLLLKIEFVNVIHDISVLYYISSSQKLHQLTDIVRNTLNITLNPIDIDDPNINDLATIVGSMQSIINELYTNLTTQEQYLYWQIELPLVKILTIIEQNGIAIDLGSLHKIQLEITDKLAQLQEIIYRISGCVFNINSSKQLQDVLFNQLKLSVVGIKKNTQGYSSNEDTLTVLARSGIDIANHLLEYRSLHKLLTTYVTKLPLYADSAHRIHTTFSQTTVITGRLSSLEPNLQNMPIKNEYGRKIRQCFIAKKYHKLICADYSQIELRILAHFSKDTNLIGAFNNEQDIHTLTASGIFHKPIDMISYEERRYAKIINFSLIYGKTAYGLAHELNVDYKIAKNYIDDYFNKYPQVLIYINESKKLAKINCYVETLMGRKIYLKNINSSNKVLQMQDERLAINAPMQGTSADIIKIAMNRIHNFLITNKLRTSIVLQIHDELILEAPEEEVDIIKYQLNDLMTSGFNELLVALTIDIKTNDKWQ